MYQDLKRGIAQRPKPTKLKRAFVKNYVKNGLDGKEALRQARVDVGRPEPI